MLRTMLRTKITKAARLSPFLHVRREALHVSDGQVVGGVSMALVGRFSEPVKRHAAILGDATSFEVFVRNQALRVCMTQVCVGVVQVEMDRVLVVVAGVYQGHHDDQRKYLKYHDQ